MNDEFTNENIVPWHRRRPLWGIVFASIAVTVFLYWGPIRILRFSIIDPLDTLEFVLGIFGAYLPTRIFPILEEHLVISAVSYFTTMGILLYKTFQHKDVRLVYPIITLSIFLTGIFFSLAYIF